MLNRFKNKLANIVNGISNYQTKDGDDLSLHGCNDVSPFPYSRPAFLQLSPDEVQVSADHISRPILVARNGNTLPWAAGYAEVINAGKTKVNEDQARTEVWTLPQRPGSSKTAEDDSSGAKQQNEDSTVHYFGIFDGHAGTGASLMAVNILHLIIQDKLMEVQNLLEPQLFYNGLSSMTQSSPQSPEPQSPSTPPFSPPADLSDTTATAPVSNPFVPANVEKTQDEADSGNIKEQESTDVPGEVTSTEDVSKDNVESIENHEDDKDDADDKDISVEMDISPSGGSEAVPDACSTDVDNQTPVPNSQGAEAQNQDLSPSKSSPRAKLPLMLNLEKFNVDNMIIGALEASFFDMDAVICRERRVYRVPGGCTALAAIFFRGKLYVANAGDSRAIMCYKNQAIPMSQDFTPETDRMRIQLMAWHHPELLCNMFSAVQFAHRITRKDIGKRVLHRDGWRKGWSFKTVTEEDIKMPLIYGEGKKARLLGTIGVSRGFGDHDLRVYESEVYVKPFMSCCPEVRVYDLTKQDFTENDVLIMGTDGLWDVTTNEKAISIVQKSLAQFKIDDPNRYVSAAQELVMHARGILKGGWRTTDDKLASGDDITAFVIPLHCHSQAFTKAASENLESPKEK